MKTFESLQKGDSVYVIEYSEWGIEELGKRPVENVIWGVTEVVGWGEDMQEVYHKYDKPIVWIDDFAIAVDNLSKSAEEVLLSNGNIRCVSIYESVYNQKVRAIADRMVGHYKEVKQGHK